MRRPQRARVDLNVEHGGPDLHQHLVVEAEQGVRAAAALDRRAPLKRATGWVAGDQVGSGLNHDQVPGDGDRLPASTGVHGPQTGRRQAGPGDRCERGLRHGDRRGRRGGRRVGRSAGQQGGT